MNSCKTCSTAIEGVYAKYCYVCRELRKKEQIKNQTLRRKQARKNKIIQPSKPKVTLPTWMLVRGTISNVSGRSSFA